MQDLSLIQVILFIAVGAIIGFLIAYVMMAKRKVNVYDSPEFKHLEDELNRSQAKVSDLNENRIAQAEEKARLEEQNRSMQESLDSRKEELEKTKLELQKEFELLANRIFEKKSTSFRESSEHGLKTLLKPFDEKLQHFNKNVSDTYIKGTKERSELKQELQQLRELNQTMTKEAHELTQALKGESKTQGNWGEVILERILENSGLEKGREYEMQFSSTLEDGRRVQPDVIVKLPEDKHVIIDSKVSLKAYELYFNAENEEDRANHLKAHIQSIRGHIKNLHSKSYTNAKGLNSPDFVLLFLPIEASFGMAVQEDVDLYDFAWKQQIVLVTPSTLLATLRTISSIWKHEKTNQNAALIAEEAGKLYDKFVSVLSGIRQTGTQFETARKTLDKTLNQIKDGRGNLISKVEKLKQMGATTTKSLKQVDQDLYDNALEAANDEGDSDDE